MCYACMCCYELSIPNKVSIDGLDYSNASYIRYSWLGHSMFECIVLLNQYKMALSGYALRDFINL